MTIRAVRDETMPLDIARTLVIGDDSPAGMHGVVLEVRRLAGDGLHRSDDVDAARRIVVDEGWHPELIVVLEAWPDRYSSAEVLRLVSLAPLARLVCVYGPWCESAGRTHSVWPPAVRVPVPLAPARVARELALLREGTASLPTATGGYPARDQGPLPLTASRGEIFEADFGGYRTAGTRRRPLAIHSPDRAFRRMLESTLGAAGFRIVDPLAAGSGDVPAAFICDVDPWAPVRAQELRSWRSRLPEARLVAATGFSRPDTLELTREAGFDAEWCKLSPLSLLVKILS